MLEDTRLLKFYIDLTPRQREVLQLVSKGLKNQEIAARLSITPSVVAEHLSNIYQLVGALDELDAGSHPNRYVVVSLFAPFFERHPDLRTPLDGDALAD